MQASKEGLMKEVRPELNSKGQKAKQWRAESQTALCEQTGGALARKQE